MGKVIKDFCPLLKKTCIEHSCKWWTHVSGKNPQSEAYLDMHDCAIRWMPVLLVQVSQMERQTGAAVESFRNESVNQSNAIATGLSAIANEAKARRLEKM